MLVLVKFLIFIFLFGSIASSDDSITEVSMQMKLVPASKAIVQWERVFSSERRKQKYGIDQLSPDVQILLKAYLIEHAADSSQPMVPGL